MFFREFAVCLFINHAYIPTYISLQEEPEVRWITYRELSPGSDPAGVIVLCSWVRHFALITACFHLTGTLWTKRGERAILQRLLCRLIAQCFTPPRSVSLIPVNWFDVAGNALRWGNWWKFRPLIGSNEDHTLDTLKSAKLIVLSEI